MGYLRGPGERLRGAEVTLPDAEYDAAVAVVGDLQASWRLAVIQENQTRSGDSRYGSRMSRVWYCVARLSSSERKGLIVRVRRSKYGSSGAFAPNAVVQILLWRVV